MQINNRQTRQPDTIRKLPEGPLADPQAKSGPVIPSNRGGHVTPGKLKTLEASVQDHKVLNDANLEDKSEIQLGNKKRVFWQTSINDQRPKLRVRINGIVIVGLIDTGAEVSIITPESWHLNWPLQEADVQLLGIGTISRVKQSTRWVHCIGPEGQRGKLRPYVADIAINLWGHDLLQQWNTQISIPAVPGTHNSGKDIIRYYEQRSPAIQTVQEHKATSKPLKVPTVLPLK